MCGRVVGVCISVPRIRYFPAFAYVFPLFGLYRYVSLASVVYFHRYVILSFCSILTDGEFRRYVVFFSAVFTSVFLVCVFVFVLFYVLLLALRCLVFAYLLFLVVLLLRAYDFRYIGFAISCFGD